MATTRRVLRYIALGLGGLALAAFGLVLVLSRTGVGVERTGRFVVERLEASIDGALEVDRFSSGNLLRGVKLHGVVVTGPDDRLILEADSARVGYQLRSFLSGSVLLSGVRLYGPDVVVEQLPGQDRWNYQRLFKLRPDARDTASSGSGQGLVVIRDAEVHDGDVTVRFPWAGGENADTSRLLLETVAGDTVRVLRFRGVQGRLDRVVLSSPEIDGQLIEVDDLVTDAHIWRTPAEVRSLHGRVTIQDSVVTYEADRARLPSSELEIRGRVVLSRPDRYELHAASDDVAFRDLQWVHPPLPDEGGGALRFTLQTVDEGMLFLAEEADVSTPGTNLVGSFGVIAGETLRLTEVDVRGSPLDLDLLDRLLPADLPLSGQVFGTVQAEGPWAALRTVGDVRYRTFDDQGAGADSEFRWDGTLSGEPPYVLRDLDVELESVDLAQIAQFAPGLRLRGVARGAVRANGSLNRGMLVDGDVTLDHGDARSSVNGAGRFSLGASPTFDLEFDADPVALQLLEQQFPGLQGLRGDARGSVTVSGGLGDLVVNADLTTPAGGVVVRGTLGLDGPEPEYRVEGEVTEFRLDRVVADLPETQVTSRFAVNGSGVQLETVGGTASVDVLSATFDGIEAYRGTLRGEVVDGVAQVDSFAIATEIGDATARGGFGLFEGRTGELVVDVRADSLIFLEPLIFGDRSPAAFGLAERTRLDGTVTVNGRLTGSLDRFRATGTARVRSLLYDQLEVAQGRVDVIWEQDSLQVDASVDTLRHGQRQVAMARAQGSYADGRGVVEAAVHGRSSERVEVMAAFEPEGDVVNLDLWRLELETEAGQWTLADTTRASVGGNGVYVGSLVLARDPGPSRIRVAGTLPWRQPAADEVQEASLVVQLDSVRVGELLKLTQTDTLVGGVVTGGVQVDGTALQPELEGELMARSFRYAGAVVDSVRAVVAYEDRRVNGSFLGWEGGTSIVTGRVSVPMDLALTDKPDRLIDETMDVEFRADGVPAGLLTFLAPGFRDLEGRVEGAVTVIGTPVSPDLRGRLTLRDGAGYFQPLRVAYRDVEATARMVESGEVQVEADVRTEHGTGQVRGTLDLTEPTDPGFDLRVDADRLDASRRRDVAVVVDGRATLQGRYTRPEVNGDLFIREGELNLDEVWREYQIVQLDTTLFQMLDTAQVSYRPSPGSPFLRNLRVTDTTLRTRRDFWIRSQDLNVEVGGSLSLALDRQSDDFRLTGALEVLAGSYNLLSRGVIGGRRFEIREGTIEFVGAPGLDPNLDIVAAYRVRRAQGDPINVIADLTGTLQDPRVQLSSDADIPMSDTELVSYLLFGRAGAELTQAELDVASGGSLAVGLFRPAVTDVASSLTQQLASSLGLPVDYVALSLPEYGVSEYGEAWGERGARGLFQNAQVEIGFDPSPNVSVIGSVRWPRNEASQFGLRQFGARIEYRPWQTWTIEGFIEDQFARTPSFGPAEISDRKVLGFSFFREWTY